MKDKFFIDTNIFIYSIDIANSKKQNRSKELIQEGILNDRGVISFQVVQEFINSAKKKFQYKDKYHDLCHQRQMRIWVMVYQRHR